MENKISKKEIIYEDSDILVINKPAGIVVHPDTNHKDGTLVNWLINYCPMIKEAIVDPSDLISCQRAGIVHRLDRDTSGLLVIAKNRDSLLKLQELIRQNKMTKIYQALLYGRLDKKKTVELNIVRSSKSDRAMTISYDQAGRYSLSIFKPIQYYQYQSDQLTLCEVKIKTGRTHQIRLHAISIGHPVIGDQMYHTKSSRNISKILNISRQFLHASKLSFPHPRTQKQLIFESQLPDDLKKHLTKFSDYFLSFHTCIK